jgi:hypothetical protein
MFMVWSGFDGALNQQHATKQTEKRVYSSAMATKVMLPARLGIAHCMQHNIELMILPPHSSHYTQPLDLALKAAMAVEIDKTIRTGIMRVLKVEWLTACINARATAFSMKNILAGWFAAGLSPFNPAKVLDRFTDLTPTEGNNRPQTPNTSPLFPDTILNSSPSDAISMHQRNNALIGLINSNQPLSTPAKRN